MNVSSRENEHERGEGEERIKEEEEKGDDRFLSTVLSSTASFISSGGESMGAQRKWGSFHIAENKSRHGRHDLNNKIFLVGL